MTLREMHYFAVGSARRAKEDWRQRLTIAHTTAALMRQKKLPRLATLLPREERKVTPKQRAAEVRDLIGRMSRPGEVTYVKRKKAKT
jgi:hypothetical protein